ESNIYKHLEAICYALHQFPDRKLEQKMDSVIKIIAAAQQSDGYVYIWGINRDLPEWSNVIVQDESLSIGHLYEAAAVHHELFKNNSFLNIAKKSADNAFNHFVSKNLEKGFPGHAGMELGLVELFRVTNNTNYLCLSREFIERRGHGLNGNECDAGERLYKMESRFYPLEYYQDHKPFREQCKIVGHAVRGVYFLTGILDVALETGDKDYVSTTERLWNNLTKRKMFITGSAGPLSRMESFGMDYELPNDGNNESCVAVGLANLASKMLRLKTNIEYSDILEKVLYNAILHAISLDGISFNYNNPLHGDVQRGNFWSCCPPNTYRTLLGIGKYMYTKTDEDIFVHLYAGSDADIKLRNNSIKITQETDYPWDGKIKLTINPETPQKFNIHYRIPGWCKKYSFKVNGERVVSLPQENGYLTINRMWAAGDMVQIYFDMPVVLMEANPLVRSDIGKVAIQRGPIVYAIEGIDNGGEVYVTLPDSPKFEIRYNPDLLNGIMTINGKTAYNKPFVAIPYYALANRGKSNTNVWLKKDSHLADSKKWEGELYRICQ
ncbi:MAG: glycoside hydrolase family 127 protein, partial [Porphyromonadaceae bacterium]|nr:glycoside hydrolase family 127 protein [Porphyromonadaceae bacterium]